MPVDGAELSSAAYGPDRVFLILKRKGEKFPAEKELAILKEAEYPVIEVVWPDAFAIGAEFLGWEIATAVASAVLEINPFDEPNVRESKEITGRLLDEYKKQGKLNEPDSLAKISAALPLENFLKQAKKDGYAVLLAYLERNAESQKQLDRIRRKLAAHLKLPVLVGFGPRYLHSIGQLYKGGPLNGLFVEFISRESKELPIAGSGYGFGLLKRAQAFGDMEALKSKGLPVLGIDLGKDWESGLRVFEKILESLTSK